MTAPSEHTEDSMPSSEHEHAPRGTLAVTMLFLALCIFMFGWAYIILIAQG
ncbi:MAG: hypothetical protein AAGA99_07625 [Actinomycetota bacterium]